jgi:hypothetical protein
MKNASVFAKRPRVGIYPLPYVEVKYEKWV